MSSQNYVPCLMLKMGSCLLLLANKSWIIYEVFQHSLASIKIKELAWRNKGSILPSSM